MNKFSANNIGFTIIELLVVITIVAIISVLGAANYHRGNEQVLLDGQVAQFAQDVRQVQEWALSSKQLGAATSYGYGIYIPAIVSGAPQKYYLYSDNSDPATAAPPKKAQYDDADTIAKTVVLDKKIKIDSCSLCNPAKGMSVNYIAPDLTAKIVKEGTGGAGQNWGSMEFSVIGNPAMKRTVCVNRAGLVYVSKSGSCPE
jgi:prepilin-type N-terminal cleavage/methylation domain-containing protein